MVLGHGAARIDRNPHRQTWRQLSLWLGWTCGGEELISTWISRTTTTLDLLLSPVSKLKPGLVPGFFALCGGLRTAMTLPPEW
ncbi:MAG: hypothetical protein ACJAVZ_001092 [Afipia broomeae]|jgi:hypothetical protein